MKHLFKALFFLTHHKIRSFKQRDYEINKNKIWYNLSIMFLLKHKEIKHWFC